MLEQAVGAWQIRLNSNMLWTGRAVFVYYLIMTMQLSRLLVALVISIVSHTAIADMRAVTLAHNHTPSIQMSLASTSFTFPDRIQAKPAYQQQASKSTLPPTTENRKSLPIKKKVVVRSKMVIPKPARVATHTKQSMLLTVLKVSPETESVSQNTTTYEILPANTADQAHLNQTIERSQTTQTFTPPKKLSSRKNQALKKKFAIMGIAVDQSRFGDLVGIFNSFQIRHEGSKQDDVAVSMCYRATDGTYLEFGTDDESDEDNKIINDITISKMKGMVPDVQCDESLLFSEKMKFKNGIHLGMDKAEILEKLGTPEDIGNQKFIYTYADEMDFELEFDASDKVEAISLFKPTQAS